MHLKSITLKGFKSFPDRTQLDFGPGISVIVGPNGSGKSNVTDAVLWALGEQSPLAIRGQTMQDVVFAGGHGVKGRNAAEVEVVIDNSDGLLHTDFSEISISRRLDRSGDGTYRLNGARCRLVDVLEVLSDTGLGKEMHSVISQGRVEAIVHSKPVDRTALIEEAAGLTKHRRRRHRARLKLHRTQDNLDRALGVEREARSRLRPLKRQAEAAELHARLERQGLELRLALTGDDLHGIRRELDRVTVAAEAARRRRDGVEAELMGVARAREHAESGFTEQARERELLSARMFAKRSAAERISLRLESARESLRAVSARLERTQRAVSSLTESSVGTESPTARLDQLEAERERLEHARAQRLASDLEGVESEQAECERLTAELAERIAASEQKVDAAGAEATRTRAEQRQAGEAVDGATRRIAALELELDTLHERVAAAAGQSGDDPVLADLIEVEPGYETAVAAVLGARLHARLVETVAEGAAAVERGGEGGRALVRDAAAAAGEHAPVGGAEPLIMRVQPQPAAAEVVRRLLSRAWLVGRLSDLPRHFSGIAVTRAGTAYDGELGEVRRPAAAARRGLTDRSRIDELQSELRRERDGCTRHRAAADAAPAAVAEATHVLDRLEDELRELRRRHAEALESARRAAWVIRRRREHASGPEDGRLGELSGEIAAERRLADRVEQERAAREARMQRLAASIERDRWLLPAGERSIACMEHALRAIQQRLATIDRELAAGEGAGEQLAAELRRLAQAEYELQGRLREAAELLTQEEVRAAHVRDRTEILTAELAEIVAKLGGDEGASDRASEGLAAEDRDELSARLERLERRRERLGPVNPLAEQQYADALEHVEELEGQRHDLEQALGELQRLIRETDRRIRESFDETFEAAARNFEEVIQRLFPGGKGRLRRVAAQRPRPVLGGEEQEPEEEATFGEHAATTQAAGDRGPEGSEARPSVDPSAGLPAEGNYSDTPGIEIEVTPAGKTTRRLSLLSGGEKSLVALAFMFAVFLARPCPFYILDEVEAALDDSNIGRFLDLVRSYATRAQFIVITHQRRTMEAADVLYGISMGKDGVSKVVSRRLEQAPSGEPHQDLTQAA